MSSVKISASDVKKLRDITGAGMMDCKKALVEASGDTEKAIEFLRKKGQKLSIKRADREATEGVVLALTDQHRNNGVVLRLSCETDFVAKNEAFVELTESFAKIALKNLPDSLEDLLNLDYDSTIKVGDKVIEQIGVIGEKLEISNYAKLTTAPGEGQILSYIHLGNRAAVILSLNLEGPDYIDAGRNVAMQVAAMKPMALDKNGIDSTVVEKEIEIGKDQARQEGKPEDLLDKIAMGRLNKFYKENTLVNQQYVKDSKKSVQQYLESVGKGLKATAFKHIQLG